ncbi:Ovarian cancer-associated protein 2 [Aspergillus nanangensis]|uniref:Ovarian cancer-associated protein 2 n=1 Tax=Aspergillus nanangensis TaxID=2582783 RepID=A0AAD4GY50_ASPNN|nr:Ovarian cancer-associated protein 2 [Aspergillus nanangensis]
MARHGPFDGVIGSSAGSTLAVALASMLERPGRCSDLFPSQSNHPPFRFILGYSGFVMENPIYQRLYYPKLRTPALFIYGEVDTFVPAD